MGGFRFGGGGRISLCPSDEIGWDWIGSESVTLSPYTLVLLYIMLAGVSCRNHSLPAIPLFIYVQI